TAGWISRLVDTPLGRRIVNELRGHGVDVSRVLWAPDGRIGIYFLEQGIPPRQHRIIYDRAQSAMALLDPKEVDWGVVRSARLLLSRGETAEQLAEQLALRFSAGTVVVTDAGRCAAAQNGQVVSKEGYEVESVDRVGAGDAFAAGFIHGYLTGGLDRALEYA